MNNPTKTYNRRQFLGEASCAGIGSIAALSSLLNLRLAGSLSAADTSDPSDYRAMVCVFLGGGNDSFNMLTPYSGDERTAYEETRAAIGYPVSEFVRLPGTPSGQTDLGLHKNMPNLQGLYEGGKAAFISNVGTLIEPTSVAAIDAGYAKLPVGLFSHADQSLQWQSGQPETRSPGSGWGGRMADLLSELNEVPEISMNISLAGINLFQSGLETTLLAKTSGAIPGLQDWNSPNYLPRRKMIQDINEAQYQHIFERAFSSQNKNAIETAETYRFALENTEPLETSFNPANALSLQLKDVAEGIAARGELGKCRQTFFVMSSGWDHHSSLDPHPTMLALLDQAVGEFQNAMEELNLSDKVTLFTASDFGRTLTPNSGGSDHGWGGNQFVVGGGVNGGKVYGSYPDLTLGSALDMGRARLIPTTSVDQYFADLALWMGVSSQNIASVLPNLYRFHDVINSGPPLGLFTD